MQPVGLISPGTGSSLAQMDVLHKPQPPALQLTFYMTSGVGPVRTWMQMND